MSDNPMTIAPRERTQPIRKHLILLRRNMVEGSISAAQDLIVA